MCGALIVIVTGKWVAARRPAPSGEIIDPIAEDRNSEEGNMRD